MTFFDNRFRFRSFAFPLAAAVALPVAAWACSSSPGTGTAPPDAGLNPDASVEPDGEPSAADASDASTALDAGDASDALATNPADDVMLFAGVDSATNAWGGSFASGAWTTSTFSAKVSSAAGGGVTVIPGRRGVVAFRDASTTAIEAANWTRSWSALASTGTAADSLSAPAPNGAGARLIFQDANPISAPDGSPLTTVSSTVYTPTSSWQAPAQTTALGDTVSVPGAIARASGDELLFLHGVGILANTYAFATTSTGSLGWTPTVSIEGSVAPASGSMAIVGVDLPGSDDVVVAMNGKNPGEIDVAVQSNYAWTTQAPAVVVTDAATTPDRAFSLTALPDGRAALAYVDANQALHFGFYSAGAWSAFQVVPGTGDTAVRYPVAIARGAYGESVIEMVYIDGTGGAAVPRHVRLTNEAGWTWSAPVAVSTGAFDAVYVSVGP